MYLDRSTPVASWRVGSESAAAPGNHPNALRRLADELGCDVGAWSKALSRALGTTMSVCHVDLGAVDGVKAHGMTHSVRLTAVEPDGNIASYFVKMPDEDLYGETLRCDQVRELVWRLDGYPSLLGHVQCLAVRIGGDGLLYRADNADDDWCLIEPAVTGEPLADRMFDLDDATARRDAEALADYLVALHQPVAGDDGRWYRRMVRDTLMNAVFRLIDGGLEYWGPLPKVRAEVEHGFIEWRMRLGGYGHRLRRTHNDFHPWNVFVDGGKIQTVGARLPGMGDPADDLAAVLVNYLWIGCRTRGAFSGAYRLAYDTLWRRYLELGGDDGCAAVFAPFFAKRLLVLLNPVYYPGQPAAMTDVLTSLLLATLRGEVDALSDPEALAQHCDEGLATHASQEITG